MAHVSVTINGRQYRMACEDGQENHLVGSPRISTNALSNCAASSVRSAMRA